MSELLSDTALFGADIPWLEGLRSRAKEAFFLPNVKFEPWKYTKLSSLKRDDFVYSPSKFLEELEGCPDDDCDCDCDCGCGCEHHHEHDGCGCNGHCQCSHKPELYLDLPFDAYQIHFYNGKFMPLYPALPAGIEVMTLMQAVIEGEAKNYVGKYIDLAQYPFAALNTAMLEEGLFVKIDADVSLQKPLMFIYHTQTEESLVSNIRNVFVIGKKSSLEIVEYYYGNDGGCYFNNTVNEFYLAFQSNIKHYTFQNEGNNAVHIALNYANVRENAFYKSFCLQRGANLGRNETKVDLLQEKAKAQVDAAYIANVQTTLDTTTDIAHLSPKTSSDQLVKGVASGQGKGVFQGKISISKDAQETEGHQLHRALLLSDTAEIDVKPELEIYADNVKCSHGAACGELDQNQLFYMRSRGIGEEEAKQILIDAYLLEAINRIDNEQIKEWIAANV